MAENDQRLPYWKLLPELVSYAASLKKMDVASITDERPMRSYCRIVYAVIWTIRQVKPQYYSYPYLGEYFGYKDHTTALHGYKRAATLRDKDYRFRLFTDKLLAFCKARMLGSQKLAERRAA